MKKLIVIAGPTASGKTSLAVAVAKQLKAPIISADSRQFYKELSIGTAKPTAEEMQGVPHYFVDSHSIHHPLTAGRFEKEALEKVNELFQTIEHIVIVGGSGMFINALIYGTDQLPHDPEIRAFWNEKLKHYGIEYLQDELKKVDLEYYQNSDIQNPVRIIRALEIFEITGRPYSQLRNQKKKIPRFPTDFYVIDHPREILYERINHRVDLMIEEGLIEEVRANQKNKHLQALNTVGYKEIFEYLEYNLSYEKAIELVKQNTRRYAKRQLTWFRKIEDAQWIKPTSLEEMTELICKNV